MEQFNMVKGWTTIDFDGVYKLTIKTRYEVCTYKLLDKSDFTMLANVFNFLKGETTLARLDKNLSRISSEVTRKLIKQ